jgi:DNA repair protein RecN (Recombination protein N)
VRELDTLDPRDGEEERLAADRQRLQKTEKRAETIAAAIAELAPSHGRGLRQSSSPGPGAALRAAARVLQRLAPQGDAADEPTSAALAALERAEEALSEAELLLARLAEASDADPRQLEQAEERLFALRAAARKQGIAVADLPAFHAGMRWKPRPRGHAPPMSSRARASPPSARRRHVAWNAPWRGSCRR